MATAAILAHGTKIKLGDGGSPTENFAEIGEVGDFDYNESVALVDVTNHQSGGYKEFIADIIEGEEVSFPVNYIDSDATHNMATGLRGMLGDAANFQIEAPGETNGIQFNAVITGIGRSFPVSSGALQMNVTLKPSGVVTEYTIA